MIREAEYLEIFEIIRDLLKEKYENEDPPNSTTFEFDAPGVIRCAIEVWNSTHVLIDQIDFEVEHLGGSKFPDIVLHNRTDNEVIGIEVKFHKAGEEWGTLGNSTIASTQIQNLAAIFVLFGHFGGDSPEFQIKNYGSCICDITKTHNPRYKLNMNVNHDFCLEQLGISYDDLRHMEKAQREIVVNSYMATTDYVELPNRDDCAAIRARSFILFPEVFSHNYKRKYQRLAIWLFASNIFCRNVRDFISGSGRVKIDIIGDQRLPRVFYKLYMSRNDIRNEIAAMHPALLKRSWYPDNPDAATIPEAVNDRLSVWIDLICAEYGGEDQPVVGSPYDFRSTIQRLLG